jgi:hypothetical protein
MASPTAAGLPDQAFSGSDALVSVALVATAWADPDSGLPAKGKLVALLREVVLVLLRGVGNVAAEGG